jgi:hypothetical protein
VVGYYWYFTQSLFWLTRMVPGDGKVIVHINFTGVGRAPSSATQRNPDSDIKPGRAYVSGLILGPRDGGS